MTLDSVPELARRVLHLEMELKRNKPSHGTDNAALLKRISALESSVAMISKATPAKPQVYTPKPAATVPKPADKSIATKMATLEREVERLKVKESQIMSNYGRPVFLSTPLTSTSWDGDSFSTTSKTLIDLSAVFGVPAGVKAVSVKIALRDSGSAAASCVFQLSGISSGTNYSLTAQASPINDRYAYFNGIVPCDANGDVYYQINASGSATMDVYLEIWGYWL